MRAGAVPLDGLDSGRYQIELCNGWTGCQDAPEWMAFNNKTCSAGVEPVYGNTVGPLLRGSDVSDNWRTWSVEVVSKETDSAQVTIQNEYPAARCSGYYVSDYSDRKDACKDTEWADRTHLHKSASSWTVSPVEGNSECFNIVNADKPEGCLRYLGAQGDCDKPYLRLSTNDDGSGLQQWKFVKVGASPSPVSPSPPSPSPSPPVSPPPSPTVQPIRAPVISGPSETSSGYADVVVQDFGGGNTCSVVSITFFFSPNTIGASQQSIEVLASEASLVTSGVPIPMPTSGFNSIYAVGKCSTGEETGISNQLSVFSYVFAAPACLKEDEKCGDGSDCCPGLGCRVIAGKRRRNSRRLFAPAAFACQPPLQV